MMTIHRWALLSKFLTNNYYTLDDFVEGENKRRFLYGEHHFDFHEILLFLILFLCHSPGDPNYKAWWNGQQMTLVLWNLPSGFPTETSEVLVRKIFRLKIGFKLIGDFRISFPSGLSAFIIVSCRRFLLSSNELGIVNESVFVQVVALEDGINESVQLVVGEYFFFHRGHLLWVCSIFASLSCWPWHENGLNVTNEATLITYFKQWWHEGDKSSHLPCQWINDFMSSQPSSLLLLSASCILK